MQREGNGNPCRANLKPINDTMKIKKQNRLVKTDKQQESAFVVFWSIIVGGILLIVTVIMENL